MSNEAEPLSTAPSHILSRVTSILVWIPTTELWWPGYKIDDRAYSNAHGELNVESDKFSPKATHWRDMPPAPGQEAAAELPLRSARLTVKELRAATKDLPEDLELLCRAGNNDSGTIWSPHAAVSTTYSFFGRAVPCLLIEHSDVIDPARVLWLAGETEAEESATNQ